MATVSNPLRDPNTLSNYNNWTSTHISANFDILFEQKKLVGNVIYILKSTTPAECTDIILDTSYVDIGGVKIDGKTSSWELLPRLEPYGAALKIKLDQGVNLNETIAVDCTFDFNITSPLPVIASGLPVDNPAEKSSQPGDKTLYQFKQRVPIPSYLFALASGDISEATIGPRSAVATSPDKLRECQWELEADTEKFIDVIEKIVYPYVWAAVHGEPYRHFSAIIGWKALTDSVDHYGHDHEFTKLITDLKGKDPDDAFSSIPYEKGFNFLFHLETLYFTTFKGKSLDSYEFKDAILSFFKSDIEATELLKMLDWDAWFYAPGLPPKPSFDTSLVDVVYELSKKWKSFPESFKPQPSDVQDLTANQVVVFLEQILFEHLLTPELSQLLGKVYGLATSENIEIANLYFQIGLKAGDESVLGPTAELLGKVGRMKFVRPLYRNLHKFDRALAIETFEKHRDFYHPICRAMIEKDLFGTKGL
ncbi:bifunctional aminopeptidase/epoxide hydrolase [Aspergillus tanneri]|uniref:Peptidase M1 leukotriene A4 hydrolase/aminopeptidase C-terminal domain-containing protein n=1 Tax=Aspergillus tanneri TaxID=1220188 RepID=A0A5M9N1X0_9EURO|nr:uncharacterized protein ATNIH1004_001200 [Aspergillus tanneri]KAA8652296.1 hypothetical protein ATNIH1004_001200 [Aspergillus tanneri]